jgi:hypothetical protein
MKNKFQFNRYTLAFASLLLSAGLSSCGNESVRHTKDEPFVIMSIQKYSDGKVKYSKGKYERPFKEFFATGKQSIIFDNDLGYNVGDTLSFQPCR